MTVSEAREVVKQAPKTWKVALVEGHAFPLLEDPTAEVLLFKTKKSAYDALRDRKTELVAKGYKLKRGALGRGFLQFEPGGRWEYDTYIPPNPEHDGCLLADGPLEDRWVFGLPFEELTEENGADFLEEHPEAEGYRWYPEIIHAQAPGGPVETYYLWGEGTYKHKHTGAQVA